MSTALSNGSPTRRVSIRLEFLDDRQRLPAPVSGSRATDLALIEPEVHHPLHDAVQVGIGNNEGRFRSKDSFFPVPAVAARMRRPTSVDPVKAILSTPVLYQRFPARPSPPMMLTTPAGRPIRHSSANRRR
jgi:hypothetical protein